MFWMFLAVVILGGYYFDLEKAKLRQEKRGGANSKDVKRKLGQLMAENEDMKERIKNLEYLMGEKDEKINWDYEKEQIRLDNDEQKFRF